LVLRSQAPGIELDVLASLKQLKAGSPKKDYAAVKTVELQMPSDDAVVPAAVLPQRAREVPFYVSIRAKFWCILVLLFAALLAIMIITITTLKSNGSTWMEETTTDMKSQQIAQLSTLVNSKSLFIEVCCLSFCYSAAAITRCFQAFVTQMTVDLRTFAVFTTALLNYSLVSAANVNDHHRYLASYAQSTGDPYTSAVTSSTNYSSYFYKEVADCETTSCYYGYYNAYNTRLTSLMDLKMRSYSYKNSYVSVIQFAFANSSLIRNYPYSQTSLLTNPTTCPISDLTLSMCTTAYYSSACANSGVDGYSYPAYDPRCRSWFHIGLNIANKTEVYFQTPRLSSAGQFIVTTIAPIYAPYSQSITSIGSQPGSDQVEGVVNFNVLMSELSNALNSLPILENGYNYLIDTSNTTVLIIHPDASATCTSIECVEGMTNLLC
jgi:hypothetical protein